MPVQSSIPLLTSVLLVSTPDPSLLAFAVVTTTVGSLHDTGCAISTLVVAMAMVARLSSGFIGLIKHNNDCDEDGGGGRKEESGGSHLCVVDLLWCCWLLQLLL